jgi:flagellar basal body-associated protein FliL
MRTMYIILISVVVLALVSLVAVPWISSATKGEATPPQPLGERTVPPIDTVRPAVTETADFGLG